MTQYLCNSHRHILRCAALVLALTVSGCGIVLRAGKLASPNTEPSFTYTALRASEIGIGGFTSLTAEMSPQQRQVWVDQMSKTLRRARKDLDVVPPSRVAARAGTELLEHAVDEFRQKEVQAETLQALRERMGKLRYLAFARMEVDRVERRQYERKVDENGAIALGSEVTRTVEVYVAVYDLTAGKSVWSGTLSDTSADANVTRGDQGPSIFSLLAGLLKMSRADKDQAERLDNALTAPTEYPPYPEAPPTADVLPVIFGPMGEGLPKPMQPFAPQ